MSLIERVQAILMRPRQTWPVIAAEPADVASLYTRYAMILAAIPAVCGFIGMSLIGFSAFGVSVRVPLVSGAAIRFDGQVSVFDAREASSPCYACLFPPDGAFEETRCATLGVFAPLVGIVGAVQAAEALKLLAGVGTSLAGRLQMLDARTMGWTELRTPRRAACPVCANR